MASVNYRRASDAAVPPGDDIHISVLITTPEGDQPSYALQGLKRQTREPFEIVWRESSKPLAAARNDLAELANGNVYAFLDADAMPTQQWVEELAAGYQSGAIAVGGPAEPAFTDRYHREIPRRWHWLIGCGPYHDEVRAVSNTYGCNYSVKAEVFDQLGGFDERFGIGADFEQGEDAEFARRMRSEYGQAMLYMPGAAVHHHVFPDQTRLRSLLARAYGQGVSKAAMGISSDETAMARTALREHGLRDVLLLGATALGFGRGKLAALLGGGADG